MNVWARHCWMCRAFVAAMLVLVWTVEVSGQEPPAPTLLDALEREAIPLRSELDALRRQRSEAERSSKAHIDTLRREVEALTRRREAAWRSIAESERTLRTLDARLDSMPQSTGDPSKVLTRAERRLLPDAEPLDDPGERLTRVFTAAGERLLQASRVRRDENVSFFLADGSRVEGTVITVGTVAAAGVTPDGQGGPLVPLSEAPGARQVVMEAGPEVTAYLRSDDGGPLPVLVVDPRHPPSLDAVRSHRGADEALNEHTWRDTITDAAPVGYVILGLGLVALLVALYRAVWLAHLAIRERKVGAALLQLMEQTPKGSGRLDPLKQYVTTHEAALCRIVRQALDHRELPLELYETRVQVALFAEVGRVGRGLSALRAVAAVAPLLGLLGTVIGMIATFEALTASGTTTDPEALSGGIAQALATTQLGLMVAVPTLLVYSGLKSWSNRVEEQIEYISVELSTHIRDPHQPREQPLSHPRKVVDPDAQQPPSEGVDP